MTYGGIVQRGRRFGTSLGFPTANVPFDGLESGIFAASVMLEGKKHRAAVYADQKQSLLEAHLLDYAGSDFYDKELEIELLRKLREDKRFDSEGELKAAIAGDVQAAREYFAGQQ